MNLVINDFTNLVELNAENKNTISGNYDSVFEELKARADNSTQICQIVDFEKYAQVYFNPVAIDYFGVSNEELRKLGFKYVFKYLHPENFNIIYSHISYFNSPNNFDKILSCMYYVNTSKGWRWLYNNTKVESYTISGKAKYLFVEGKDINDIFEDKESFKKLKKNLDFVGKNIVFFDLLTTREKEILQLIVDEKSSIEIGHLLNISSATVDTHRNNIITKLQVKSSVGLVKFAAIFAVSQQFKML